MREQHGGYTVPRRASAPPPRQTVTRRPAYTDTTDDDNLYDYQPRVPTSSIRYDRYTDQSYNPRQLPAPKQARQTRRFHWIIYVWLIILCAMALLFISSLVVNLWQRTMDSFHYGFPRSYQVDADVGHGDSHHKLSHFVAINDKGLIEVIEIPGDPGNTKPYLYVIARISSDNADQVPVTLSFGDGGDGKVDVFVHVGDTTYILFNTGSAFKQGS